MDGLLHYNSRIRALSYLLIERNGASNNNKATRQYVLVFTPLALLQLSPAQ